MKKYVVKDVKERHYKNVFGVTDFDIPMFSLKSAFLIMGVTILSMTLVITLCQLLQIDFVIPNSLITGTVCGFSVSFAQFFIERKEGLCKSFWIVGGLLSLISACVIFIF